MLDRAGVKDDWYLTMEKYEVFLQDRTLSEKDKCRIHPYYFVLRFGICKSPCSVYGRRIKYNAWDAVLSELIYRKDVKGWNGVPLDAVIRFMKISDKRLPVPIQMILN